MKFNVFPDWMPPLGQQQHRRALNALYTAGHTRKDIKSAVELYICQMKVEHARQKEMSEAERNRYVLPGYWLPIPISDEFVDFANFMWAIRIGKAEGPEAGQRAFLAGREVAFQWWIGKRVQEGGGPQSEDERAAENTWLLRKFQKVRKREPKLGWTPLCERIGELHDPQWAESTVRGKLKKMRRSITSSNFRKVPLD